MGKYKIYHIPDFIWPNGDVGKIGVSCQVKKRIKANLKKSEELFEFWEVIEEHDCKYQASVREIELQKQYGYRVDTTQYHSTIGMSSKGGKASTGSFNHWDKEKHSQVGKLGYITTRNKFDWNDIRKRASETMKLNGKTRGSNHHMSVFSEDEICNIKNQWNSTDMNMVDLSKKYNVSRSVICNIINNKTYKDIGPVCIKKKKRFNAYKRI